MPIPPLHTEPDLLRQVAEGSEEAFAQLFQHYHQALGTYLFEITKSREVTEELVQDCFLKVWMARESLTEIRNFRTWLFVLSKNAAISAFRKSVSLRTQNRAWELASEETERQEPGWAQKEAALSLVDEAIAALSPRQKEIFHLSRHAGYSYEEIARQLGLSKLTVREHVKQAVLSITRYVRARAGELPAIFLLLHLLREGKGW